MNTLYVVQGFNTLDGAPDLQHMQRCASAEAAELTGKDFSARYQGVLVYSRDELAPPGASRPRTIHLRTGALPPPESDDVISTLNVDPAAPQGGLC